MAIRSKDGRWIVDLWSCGSGAVVVVLCKIPLLAAPTDRPVALIFFLVVFRHLRKGNIPMDIAYTAARLMVPQ